MDCSSNPIFDQDHQRDQEVIKYLNIEHFSPSMKQKLFNVFYTKKKELCSDALVYFEHE